MLDNQNVQPTANKKAIVNLCKFFGAAILIGGIVYSEILFLGIVSSLFPSGPMMIGAMLGAVTTGASILVLVLAKSGWFRPGSQLAIAWIFTGIEVMVLILNDILAYQIHSQPTVCLQEGVVNGIKQCIQTGVQLDQYMASWRLFCVAAPVVSVIGWILCFYFDPQRAIDHRRMEMEDNVSKSQIDYEARMHQKTMALRIKAADMALAKFEEKVEHKLENHLDMAAAKYAARVASQLTGEHVSHQDLLGPASSAPQLSSPKVVESNPPMKAASKDQVVDPGKVKPQVDKEVKSIDKPKSFGQMLGTVHAAMHNAIDKRLDGRKDESEEVEQLPQSPVTTVFVPSSDKPILEEKNGSAKTRRLGGDEEFEAQEDHPVKKWGRWMNENHEKAKQEEIEYVKMRHREIMHQESQQEDDENPS